MVVVVWVVVGVVVGVAVVVVGVVGVVVTLSLWIPHSVIQYASLLKNQPFFISTLF